MSCSLLQEATRPSAVLDEALVQDLVKPRRAGRKAKKRVLAVAFDLVAPSAPSEGDENALKSTLAEHLELEEDTIKNFAVSVTVRRKKGKNKP